MWIVDRIKNVEYRIRSRVYICFLNSFTLDYPQKRGNMRSLSVTCKITAGPTNIHVLGLCLLESRVYPLYDNIVPSAIRFPKFIIETRALLRKFPSLREQRQHPLKARYGRLLSDISDSGYEPAIKITQLTCDESCEDKWFFKGRYLIHAETIGGKYPIIPVKGWFNITEQKGALTFFERKTEK